MSTPFPRRRLSQSPRPASNKKDVGKTQRNRSRMEKEKVKWREKGPSRTGANRNTMETREQTARIEKYMECFAEKFYDRNPKKRYPTHRELGKIAGGYSVSTVKRDIEVMLRVYKLPVAEIEEYRGWGYTEEVVNSPTVQMTKGQLVLICMAWKSLEGCRGTPGTEQVAEAFEKLLRALGPKLAADLRKVRDRISFWTASHFAPVQPEVFEAVANALFEEEELRFEYQKLDDSRNGAVANANTDGAGRDETGKEKEREREKGKVKGSAVANSKPPVERRHGQPRQLLYYDGGWYLYTDDIPSGLQRRKFMLTRMKSAQGTGVRFEPKDEFNLDEELRGFGIHSASAGEEQIVRLRYTGMSAKLVSERTYHGMESMIQNEDGTVDLTLKTVIAPELKRFVLGSGSEADILEPRNFREEMAAEATRMAEKWGK